LNLSDNRLCGFWTDKHGNMHGNYTAEGITAIADAVRVNGWLTALHLSSNRLEDEGVSAVCEAIQNNKETKLASLNFENNGIGPVGANAVAAMVAVTGGLTALDLSSNRLMDEGVSAVCKAIQSNKETKLASLNMGKNWSGSVGAKSVAAMAAVTGGLTALDLSSNDLKDEGISAVCKAIQSNKETKLASLNFESNRIGPVGANAVAAMVAVTGALTSLDLSGNQLCGLDRYGCGTYTAEGITAIADALRVNGALTQVLVFRSP
jgi:Leucine-rich repeat (LRR) protein